MNTNESNGSTMPAMETLVDASHVERAMRDLSSGDVGSVLSCPALKGLIVGNAVELSKKIAALGLPDDAANAVGVIAAKLSIVAALTMRHALWEHVLGEA